MRLSAYFIGVGAKRLSEVEVNRNISNQHEINGVQPFKEIFGQDKISTVGKFLYLNDTDADGEVSIEILDSEAKATWYDARTNHPTRTEYRLYFSSNVAIDAAKAGDLLILGVNDKKEVTAFIAEAGSTAESQLLELFNLEQVEKGFVIKNFEREDKELGFVERRILETIGIEPEDVAINYLHEMLGLFGKFPTGDVFSRFARSKVPDADPIGEPDLTVSKWYEMEYELFKTLERHEILAKLKEGFGANNDDVDDYLRYSMGIFQRRKSRAGGAFEKHLEEIFLANKLKFKAQAKLGRAKPDFIFPGIAEYNDPRFNIDLLTMLGAKTTSKERWKQLLPESKIDTKHFITMEAAISKNQTDEMIEKRIQLVLPKPVMASYKPQQLKHIISLSDFIELVKDRQTKAGL
jgi:hypothetical protein